MSSIGNLKSDLKSEKLDAFLVLTKINRQYLSAFTGSSGVLLVGRNKALLYVDPRYFDRAKRESSLPVRALENLRSDLGKFKWRKVGIEDQVSIRELRQLKQDLKLNLVPVSNWVEQLRAEKTKQELNSIWKGSRIIDKVFWDVKKLLARKASLSEIELAYQIEKFGARHGADGGAFDPIVAFGANAAIPHHNSNKQKISKNNFLLLDFGFKVNGYHSDFTRTLFIGHPSPYQQKIYQIVLDAQAAAIKTIRSNARAAEIDAAARQAISKRGFGKYFTHNTGHGVGLEIHELPNFSGKSDDRLKLDMVVTVEPGIYLPKKFGVRIEDMVWVSKRPKIFSKVPKDLGTMII